VDQLGDPPPALILGGHHLVDELAARVELLAQVDDLGPQPLVLGPGLVRHYYGASTAARLGYASQAGHEALAPVLPVFRCPACERADADVLRGGELEVESIEIAEEEECIAPR
jgi:hypothetical protein